MKSDEDKDLNRDPISGAPGAHPVGTGVGAAAAGATGAAVGGAIGGPVGAAVGAVVGAVAGGYAGKGVAEAIDPTAEEAYWRENHPRQSFASGTDYEAYAPAYRVGYLGYQRYSKEGDFDSLEERLRADYEAERRDDLQWDAARPAARAAWDRVHGGGHLAPGAGVNVP